MFWASVIAHFIVDLFSSIFKPLGPYFISRYQIEPKTFATTLFGISILTSIMQPFFGVIADKVRKRNIYLAVVLSVTILSSSMISIAGTFMIVVILILITQLFNSAFHPMGASMAGHYGKGYHLAFFSFAGMLGFATGPVIITWYAQAFNLNFMYIIGIILSLTMILIVPKMKHLELEEKPKVVSSVGVFMKLLPLFLFVSFRSFFMNLSEVYAPLYTREMGKSLIFGGLLLTSSRYFGMFMSLLGVFLRDKIGNNAVNMISVSGMTVFSLLFIFAKNDILIMVMFILMMGFSYLSMSSNVVEAQRIAPGNKGFASSIVMGTAWAFGSLMNYVYSSLFGNMITFMMKSAWVIALSTSIFVLLSIRKTQRV